jgi:hypothetical protein
MDRLAVALLLAASLAACAHQQAPSGPPTPGSAIPAPSTVHVNYGPDHSHYYLIDPNGRTCTLVRYAHDQESSITVPTDCAVLAASHPGLAETITWLAPVAAPTSSPASEPVAPTTP